MIGAGDGSFRAQQPRIPRARACAIFMIAARDDDGSGSEQRPGGGEEIGCPGRPVVAPGRSGAARIPGRTRRLAIQEISQMDTRSGFRAAAAAATAGKGHFCGSLQSCNSRLEIRQPVSPNTRMREGRALGSGRETPAIDALVIFLASGAPHTRGKFASAAARGVIARSPLPVTRNGTISRHRRNPNLVSAAIYRLHPCEIGRVRARAGSKFTGRKTGGKQTASSPARRSRVLRKS